MAVKISRLNARACIVGEGPVWNVSEQALYFVDVRGQVLVRFDPETEDKREWTASKRLSGLAFREQGDAVLILSDGVYTLSFGGGEIAPLALFPDGGAQAASNDAKVDPQGRLFISTGDAERFATSVSRPVAGLYRLDADHTLHKAADDIHIGNGPCWSPDGRTFYMGDSYIRTIYAYDFDLATGSLANRRVLATTEALGGLPDGMTVDSDGLLWGAVARGGKIVCYRPDGRIERIIETPTPIPTSVAFGGPNLDRLFFTTHVGTVLGDPYVDGAGEAYVIDGLGVRGLPAPAYRG